MVNTMFVLDRTLNTSHILSANKNSQSAFWEDTYTQEFDTGAESFEFSCYTHESIKEGNYVAFFYNNQYKMFQIIEVQEVHKKGRLVSECYCEIASLQLLNNYVKPFSGDMNCIQFFQHILHGTEWHIGKYSTSLENVVYTVNEKNIESVWALIEDYKDIYGCEINVRVTYDNGHVTGQYIDIYAEGGLGSSTFKRFEYGVNVTGITKTKDLYDWCTGIILDVECDVSNTVIEERDGYGFTKGAGDVILDDNANRMYNAGRTHVIGVYQGNETEPVEACINAWKELQKRKEPKFDYKVTTALKDDEYEDIHLGDTVYVVDHSYTPPLLLEARVGKLELSFTDRTQNSCTLTNYKEIKSKLLDADYIKLTGTISDVVNAFFPITSEGIADGAIVDGKIETTYFQQITADIVSAGVGAFENLYAQGLTVINADIEKLNATTADITELKAQVADIDTLINGHLTSDNIQSLILTSDKVTVEDAFIKDAMIDSITANKITSGSINTNNVYISSEDGSMIINGNLQQFKDKDGKVRIQIGKDANGDFTFALFSQDGVGVLIDEDGIKEGAIGDGLIVDDMVADNANIQGGKLDINSVITSINNGTTTINSNRIYLDEEGQSLQVAFEQLKTKVETIEDVTVDGDLSSVIEQVTSNTTNINIMQGEISNLIANTTITKENGEVVQLKDEYNSTKDTVDSHTTKIGSLETTVDTVSSKQASMELDLNGFRTEVSDSYATKGELEGLKSSANFIKNGKFKGVTPKSYDMPAEWTSWGCEKRIYGTPYLEDGVVSIEIREENVGGGIYQNVTGLPKNSTFTLSFKYRIQQNIQEPYCDICFLDNSGVKVGDDLTYYLDVAGADDDTAKWKVITFTTPNVDFTKVRIGFGTNYGLKAGSNYSYLNFSVGLVQLELGTTQTPWKDHGDIYVTKTEFNQTNEDFTFKIQQSGGYNLLKNSAFTNGTEYWTKLCWDGTHTSSNDLHVMEAYRTWNNNHFAGLEYSADISQPQGYIRGGFDSPYVYNLEPGGKYSFSCYASCGRVDELFIELCGSDWNSQYQNWGVLWRGAVGANTREGINYEGWTKIEFTFTAPSDAYYIFLRFWGNNHTEGSQSVSLMISQPCLVRGSIPLDWSPHPSEIYDGIVKIDSRGLTIQHNNNKSILDSEALKFYEGNQLYSKVDGGVFKVMNPGNSSSTVGTMGRTTWVNTGAYNTFMGAGLGHSVALGSVRASGEPITCALVDCSQGGHLTGGEWYYDQGLNITSASCYVLNFKGVRGTPLSEQVETSCGALSIWGARVDSNVEGNPAHVGRIFGRDSIEFGIAYGQLKVGMEMCETANTANNVALHMYGPLNMHRYSISNAGWTNPVSASSEYTSRLLREGSIENINYGTLSYYEGELRWCWKETVFTYAECDIDPATDEWVYTGRNICYVELPIFMAESIQNDYHINISKMSWGDYRIVEKNPYYFIIESQEEDFAFTFEVVAKLVDRETLNNNVSIANMSTTANPAVNVEPPTAEEIILPGSENIWQSAVVEEVEEVIDNLQENINIGEE